MGARNIYAMVRVYKTSFFHFMKEKIKMDLPSNKDGNIELQQEADGKTESNTNE